MGKSLHDHIGDAYLKDIHDERSKEEAPDKSACLWGHEGSYRPEYPCSYRWQAHQVAKKREGDAAFKQEIGRPSFIYDYRPAQSTDPSLPAGGRLKTSAYIPKRRKGATTDRPHHPADYIAEINPPEMALNGQGDWDLDGPGRNLDQDRLRNDKTGSDVVKTGENFQDCRHPYWHNAHHIIPKALLVKLIEEADENPEVAKLMKRTLMGGTKAEDLKDEAKRYNVNHGHNMIILPMDAEVAGFLKLPRHLRLKDPMVLPEGMTAEEAIDYIEDHLECTSHKDYDKKVEKKIADHIEKFATQAKEKLGAGNFCESTPSPETIKPELEKASAALLREMLEFGETTEKVKGRVYGRALADM